MRTSTKVAGFILGLAAVFALAFGAGDAFGPEATPPAPSTDITAPVPAGHGH